MCSKKKPHRKLTKQPMTVLFNMADAIINTYFLMDGKAHTYYHKSWIHHC